MPGSSAILPLKVRTPLFFQAFPRAGVFNGVLTLSSKYMHAASPWKGMLLIACAIIIVLSYMYDGTFICTLAVVSCLYACSCG